MRTSHLISIICGVGAALALQLRAHAQDAAPLPPIAAAIEQGSAPASLEEWTALEARFVALCARLRPAVVTIGGGSGVIVEGNLVLTAAHVIESPGRELTLILDDGRRVRGVSLGLNTASDTGLVRITTEGEFPHCEMGSFDEVQVGDWCALLGHPGGRRPAGPPLRIGRVLRADPDRWLVTDCTIEGGDSGGPLFDLRGRVIGIHSRINADLKNNMHVPIAAFARDWDRMLASEKLTERGERRSVGGEWLWAFGASLAHDAEAVRKIGEVRADSNAARAGLLVGDELIEVDGRAVTDGRVPLPRRGLSGVVTVQVRRGEQPIEITLPRARQSKARSELSIIDGFAAVVDGIHRSVVRVAVDERDVALGTIVRADGLLVTKASEIGGGRLSCVTTDGRRHGARRLGTDLVNDLALLRVDMTTGDEGAVATSTLVPIEWSDDAPQPGRIVVTPSESGDPIAYGVVSLSAYAPRSRARGGAAPGELGVVFGVEDTSPRIVHVRARGAGATAGLMAGDLITEVDDVAVATRTQLVDVMRGRHDGEDVELHLLRDGKELVIETKLSARTGTMPRITNPQEPLWGPLSTVRTGFAGVLAHDTVLTPDSCGGPLVTLDGRAIGLNIARTGRVETSALPVDVVRAAVQRLIADAESK